MSKNSEKLSSSSKENAPATLLEMHLFLAVLADDEDKRYDHIASSFKRGLNFYKTLDEQLTSILISILPKESAETIKTIETTIRDNFLGKSAFYMASALKNNELTSYTLTYLRANNGEKKNKEIIEFVEKEIELGKKHFSQKNKEEQEQSTQQSPEEPEQSPKKRFAQEIVEEPSPKTAPKSLDSVSHSTQTKNAQSI